MLRFFVACLIFGIVSSACSSEEWMGKKDEETMDEEQYIRLTLRLALPTDDMSLYDYTGGMATAYNGTQTPVSPGTEEGSVAESQVKDALVVLGKIANGSLSPVVVHNVHEVKGFTATGDVAQWIGYLKEVPGKYRMVVIANPLPGMKDWPMLKKGCDWTKFMNLSVGLPNNDYIGRQKENIWKDGHFMMTNAFENNVSEYEVELLQKNDNIKSILVQRVCARFDYKANKTDNVYTFPEEHKYYVLKTLLGEGKVKQQNVKIRIQLTDVALTNLSSAFHLLKMFSLDEMAYYPTPHGKETDNNYVVDTDWAEKRNYTSLTAEKLNEMFYFSSEGGKNSTGEGLQYVELPDSTDYVHLFYASENTIPGVDNQINMLSTGMIFKGEFIVEDEAGKELSFKNGDLFFYKEGTGFCLTDSREIVCRDLGLEGANINTDASLALRGINRYTKNSSGKYSVWYTYWNRHIDNKDPYKMGIMEFAVVRNNIYKLNVRSIHTLGNPSEPSDPENPWKPDGNTPNEKMPELDVAFEVSEWKSREIIYEI